MSRAAAEPGGEGGTAPHLAYSESGGEASKCLRNDRWLLLGIVRLQSSGIRVSELPLAAQQHS